MTSPLASSKTEWDERTVLEKPNISNERLYACLQQHYNITAVSLQLLPLGLDTYASVYRVVSEQSSAYLLKVTSRPLYEPRYLVPRYLRDQGIASVVAPLPTTGDALWVQIEGCTVILYPFIEGDTSLTWITDEKWKEVGRTFRRIHQVALPSSGFESLRREAFDPTEYARWIRDFEADHLGLPRGNEIEQALLSYWKTHQPTIHTLLDLMERLGPLLQRKSGPYVICHADLHPANLKRDPTGHVFVIDWDDVMLAPKERDFLFVGEPDGSKGPSPFFQGYGQTEIDWIALTYYRCERVITDVIAFAEEVLFRNDLGEESKADSVRLFDRIFEEGSMVDATFASRAHLPPELGQI
jgi:spectinomycin phosphotransferase